MTNQELHWLAGLIEGEGCIGYTNRHNRLARIIIRMRDKDVIERVRLIAGGRVNGPYIPKNKKHSPIWMWTVSGPCVRELLHQLLPLMGIRRSAKMREVMKADEKTMKTAKLRRAENIKKNRRPMIRGKDGKYKKAI